MAHHSASIPRSILQYTVVAANALQELSAAKQIPFLKSVCTLSASIVPLIETARFQKDRSLRMMHDIHYLLCALMSLCTHSESIGSPQILDQIAQYAETLQKLHACLRAQKELGRFKILFKQSEITAELDVCERELKAASDIFTTQYGVRVASDLVEMDLDTERRHQELLELISARSATFTTASSIRGISHNESSDSLSLLPASPKIFHGRDSELNDIIDTLLKDSARIAILGPGGMGKTTLAMAALHHSAIVEQYKIRHFISCESTNTSVELVSIVGSHLGLEPSNQLLKAIIQHFRRSGPCLIVLDNLETPWEPLEFRAGVEEFLSLLSDVPTLGLLITMRGAERPAKVKWNRPFLPPLEPLSPSACRQIFSAVADEPEIWEELALEELLVLSGSLPLAVSLMANIASFEGYIGTLSRWKDENTTLLADGHDKRSNLEISVMLSLGSPRISSSPHAKELLSLLSLLPDGVTDEDIIISDVPLPNIADCRSTLIRSSLAYIDVHGRLKALSPIREYMKRVHPPPVHLFAPLRSHFQHLLMIWGKHNHLHLGNLAPKLVSCLGNINDLMLQGIIEDQDARLDIAHCVLTLNRFSRTMLKGNSPLTHRLPAVIKATGNLQLKWSYACAQLRGKTTSIVDIDAACLIAEGIQHFSTVQCHIEEAITFYISVADYYRHQTKFPKAMEFLDLASVISLRTRNNLLRFHTLWEKCSIAESSGDAREMIKLVQEARKSGGPPLELEMRWILVEALANLLLGNLSCSHGLCEKINELVVASGLEDSDFQLALFFIQAEIHWRKTEYIQAHKLRALVASKTSPSRSPGLHADALLNMAYLDIMMSGDEIGILQNLDAAKAVYEDRSSSKSLVHSLVMAELYLYRGDTVNGQLAFRECLEKSRGIHSDVVGLCLAALGDIQHRMHNTGDTLHWAIVYFSFVRKAQDRVATFCALRCLADIYNESDEETALNLYHTSLEGAIEMDIHRLQAQCMRGIGDIIVRRGESTQAKEMWQASRPLFAKSSQMKDAAAIDARLAQLLEPHACF
ncbi:hypothetical protein DFH09DRAFT_125089 [Mycena vulgaris]|nr:hypothetical protein DFH09DRAFT_125089 [Mycena vulgaris]